MLNPRNETSDKMIPHLSAFPPSPLLSLSPSLPSSCFMSLSPLSHYLSFLLCFCKPAAAILEALTVSRNTRAACEALTDINPVHIESH